jgi:hypothetical protein
MGQGLWASALTDGHVIDLACRLRIFRCRRRQIGLHGVVDVAEIPAGFAVAIDINRFVLDHGGNPFGDYGGIGRKGFLYDFLVQFQQRLQQIGADETGSAGYKPGLSRGNSNGLWVIKQVWMQFIISAQADSR